MKIVALTGPKGSGKDTVGQLIKELYPNQNVRTIAFADPIKKVIQHLFNLDAENNDQYDLFKRTTLTYQLKDHLTHSVNARHVVREIGMLMRKYDEKQFVQYIWDEYTKDPTALWIVTDLRFDNEYMELKKMGAKIIKIARPSYHYDGHITERGFDDSLVDKVVMNDGDLDFLRTRVKIVMDSILEEMQ